MHYFLNSLNAGKDYNGFLAVKNSSINDTKKGAKFISMQLTDGETTLPAVCWKYEGKAPEVDTVIYTEFTVGNYQEEKQLRINSWRPAEPNECDPAQFIPTFPGDKPLLLEDFNILLGIVEDPQYKKVLDYFFEDEVIKDVFCTAPGAKGIHHAYLGGLLEHSVNVCFKCLEISSDESNVDVDLLVTGALLHDIGKMAEYEWTGCVIKKSTVGKLLGHIIIGLQMLSEFQSFNSIEREKYMLLSHLIASHHNKLEWGSPVEPQTKEAIILHHADMLDYQSKVINDAIGEAGSDGWTKRVKGIGREFYAVCSLVE